ncbi:hypothetical protein [Microvirga calopogonii]|uniref:hypothetical protein n=1 Tax=Microvirga calopogonii TaxID=2078013 RepID=UPI003CCA9CCB
MASENAIHRAVLAAIPRLRAFAIALTGNVEHADDLVQSALMCGLETSTSSSPARTCRRGSSSSCGTTTTSS